VGGGFKHCAVVGGRVRHLVCVGGCRALYLAYITDEVGFLLQQKGSPVTWHICQIHSVQYMRVKDCDAVH
jgi:hypothetical protein